MRYTVKEAIFLSTSGAVWSVKGIDSNPDALTTEQVRAIVDILTVSKSRDLNLDTALTEANMALDFRIRNGY